MQTNAFFVRIWGLIPPGRKRFWTYAGANAEFLKAFEHYRHGNIKECLNECLKAFESTMKPICTKRKWFFKATDTARTLIDVCFQNKLVPDLIQSHIAGFRAALESGIPTIRNKLAGHGQGATTIRVCRHTMPALDAAPYGYYDSVLGGIRKAIVMSAGYGAAH